MFDSIEKKFQNLRSCVTKSPNINSRQQSQDEEGTDQQRKDRNTAKVLKLLGESNLETAESF